MTGYESKKAMAQDKLEQWDTPSEAFNAWWNGEYDDSTNPFTKHSLAYWAFAGWQAALAQPAQEPVAWLTRDSVDGCWYATANKVGNDDKPLYTTPPQRPWVLQREWVDLTDEEIDKWAHELHGVIYAVMADLKEKNNG
ncbi:hypothetical protein UFOVP474_49 [uncultured Caudovirales phage]|uniref:Uncharacterized protein n=1 Tax=uncultured Caudovirales phage TaxID=2100421 RepID=A0A6J5MGS6_9CAUD|nr:hypothetical protein UFOVP474_49 [uncultured Caudovirales phage]CAB4190078.1 hypothetical protein UFOVP1207_45 [uncultured Caudovirales phage]